MKSILIGLIFIFLVACVAAAKAPIVYPWTTHVGEQFIKQSCATGGCGDLASKAPGYNPFKRKVNTSAQVQDPEVLAMAAVRKVFKAQFGKDAQDEYILKEAKSFVKKGYPKDQHAEDMLRAAYKKNPSLYLKYAKKNVNTGYSGYSKNKLSGGSIFSGSSVFSNGGSVGVSLG